MSLWHTGWLPEVTYIITQLHLDSNFGGFILSDALVIPEAERTGEGSSTTDSFSAVSVMVVVSPSNLFLLTLRFGVLLWGSLRKPSSSRMDFPMMVTVGRGRSDSCSCSSAIVAALYARS